MNFENFARKYKFIEKIKRKLLIVLLKLNFKNSDTHGAIYLYLLEKWF